MRYVLIDRAISAVRSLAAGVLADPGSQSCERDLARLVRTLFKDADMVPAEDMTEVARYARDRAREGNGSKDRDLADMADSILVRLAESKVPDKAVLVLGREGETTVRDEHLRTIVDAARAWASGAGVVDSDEILAAIAKVESCGTTS
jgi:hypothetical protein